MSLRVLHAVRSLRAETGGVATAVRALAAAQAAAGHAVRVVSLDPTDPAEIEGATVARPGRAADGYGWSGDYAPWLRAHRREFDAVVVHGLWQYTSLGAWRALAGTETPYLVYPHGMLDPWFRRTHPLKHLKKSLYWPWADYRALRDAAAVCFTGEEERRLARGSFARYRAREHVPGLGIEPPPEEGAEAQRAAFFAAHPALRGENFLLFLGRFHPKKGLEELLAAHARAGGGAPRLVVAGPCAEPDYRERLRATAGANVSWLPMLTGDVKWGALRASAGFVLLSHQENFGLAAVEAMACGRPVLLSTAVGLWREVVADGAGLAAADTVAGGGELLARWTALDEPARAAMGRAARDCFERRFTVAPAAAALSAVIAGEARPR